MNPYPLLAARLRTGMSIRDALSEWHADAERQDAENLRRLARRLDLGQGTGAAVADSELADGEDLATALDLCERTGMDAAAALDRMTAHARLRDARKAASAAATSGARLSARMIAALPLVFLPMSMRTVGDAVGTGSLVAGLVLVVLGWRWMTRTTPIPPKADEPIALLCDRAAQLMSCGLSPAESLSIVVTDGCALRGTTRAVRLVRLGMSWEDALGSVQDLAPVGAALAAAQRYGRPAAGELSELARCRREAVTSAYEARLRRAPVLMVLPLTLCVLPSFVLLGLVPLLRSLRIG